MDTATMWILTQLKSFWSMIVLW